MSGVDHVSPYASIRFSVVLKRSLWRKARNRCKLHTDKTMEVATGRGKNRVVRIVNGLCPRGWRLSKSSYFVRYTAYDLDSFVNASAEWATEMRAFYNLISE